ncbi:uncharacterized protein B0T15DRAFT_509436 [Chaetomium strumarium]|uniref:Uncharacterized protein n=1 Tax=Chaetomium strumarium TaxID=1170767 RepID=A0AAJ0GZH1_9PEZI|nr:hypothetical protein B0T15DRAFT_509436 [Chaetomium strumarium]
MGPPQIEHVLLQSPQQGGACGECREHFSQLDHYAMKSFVATSGTVAGLTYILNWLRASHGDGPMAFPQPTPVLRHQTATGIAPNTSRLRFTLLTGLGSGKAGLFCTSAGRQPVVRRSRDATGSRHWPPEQPPSRDSSDELKCGTGTVNDHTGGHKVGFRSSLPGCGCGDDDFFALRHEEKQVTMSAHTSLGGGSPGGTGGSLGGEGCGGTRIPQIVVEKASSGACSDVSSAGSPGPARGALLLPPLRPPPVAPRPFKFTTSSRADEERDGPGAARGVPPSATEPSQHSQHGMGIGVRRIPASRTEAARHGGIWDDRFIPVTQLAPSAGPLPASQTAGLLNPLRMHPTTLSRSPSTPLPAGEEDPAAGVRLHGHPPLVDRKVLEKTQQMLAAHQALKGEGQPAAASLRPRPGPSPADDPPRGLLRKVSSFFSFKKKKDALAPSFSSSSIKRHEIRHLTGSLSSLELLPPAPVPACARARVRDTQIRVNEADNVQKREKALKVLGETPQLVAPVLAPHQKTTTPPTSTSPAEPNDTMSSSVLSPAPPPQPPTGSQKQHGENGVEKKPPATPGIAKTAAPAAETEGDPFISGPSPRPTDFEKRLQATAAAATSSSASSSIVSVPQDSSAPIAAGQFPEYPPPGWI